jgi:hypothetical protein
LLLRDEFDHVRSLPGCSSIVQYFVVLEVDAQPA